MISLKQILVPTDFSDASGVAVRYGRAFAGAFQGTLHLLHVIEDPFIYAPVSEGYVPPLTFYEDMEAAAREQLERVLSPEERAESHAELVTQKGSPFVEI